MKKLLAMALALLMVAVLLPVTAMAEGSQTQTESSVAKLTIGDNVRYYDTLVEAVAAARNQQDAKIDVLQNCNGSGVEVKSPDYLDLTIDFHGFTYTMDGNAVGSTGYETQAWHIEKGSKLTLKDGKLEAKANLSAWILFQNYCDLTLENMAVNTSKASCGYVISNNFGSLTVKGNSQIIAAEGNVAFDIWYGMSEQYDAGIKVSFENFTGTVEGDIEYGAANRVNNSENWQEKASLSIDGGTFNGEIKKGNDNNTLALKDANITVTGGTFTNADTQALVANFIPAGSNLVVNPATGKVEPRTIVIAPSTPTSPEFLSGANQTVGVGAKATFRIDKDFVDFMSVAVDGITLDKTQYKAWSGSTYVELLSSYMKTLSEGTHTLSAYFNGATATTAFTISKTVPAQQNPATGANDFVGAAAALAVMSLLGMAVASRKK